MKSLLIKLSRKPFVRNVALVATGTAGAQAISMAFSPVITRLYGPESFGILGVFVSITSILTPIAALSYPMAIVLPKKDSDAKGLIKLSVLVAAMIAVAVTLVLKIFGQPMATLLGIETIIEYLFLLPIMMFFSVILAVLNQWFIRIKKFAFTAKVTVVQAIVINSTKAGIGIFYPVASVLILVTVLGTMLQSFLLWLGLRRIKTKSVDSEKPGLLQLAKRHRDFPAFRAPQIFINSISQGLPVLILTSLFGPIYAGFYTLSKTVLLMPTTLIGRSVGDVFYPRIAEAAKNGENMTQLIIKATLALAAASFIPFFIIIAIGPALFEFVFGEEWIIAGVYARWLALWMYLSLLNRPSVASIPVLGLQGKFLVYEIVSVIARAAALGVGFYHFQNHYYAIGLFSLVGLSLNIYLILFVCNRSRHYNHLKPG